MTESPKDCQKCKKSCDSLSENNLCCYCRGLDPFVFCGTCTDRQMGQEVIFREEKNEPTEVRGGLQDKLTAYLDRRIAELLVQHTEIISKYEKSIEECMENLGGTVNLKVIANARTMDLLAVHGARDELIKLKVFLKEGEKE